MLNPVFIPHGGGPLPLLQDPRHQSLIEFSRELPNRFSTRPSAIVLISAHWEASTFEITSNETPGLLYDYGGFPKEAYEIQYPCKGDASLASRIQQLLIASKLPSTLNPHRKLDHGVFVPLKLMYPNADIPIVQVSLHKSLAANIHIDLGKALAPLSKENILILGSGFSYHHLRAFFSSDPAHNQANKAFHSWLKHVCTQLSREEMLDHLKNWTMAPAARLCHPREEHLLPLMVCAGAAPSIASSIFDQSVLGKQSLGLQFL